MLCGLGFYFILHLVLLPLLLDVAPEDGRGMSRLILVLMRSFELLPLESTLLKLALLLSSSFLYALPFFLILFFLFIVRVLFKFCLFRLLLELNSHLACFLNERVEPYSNLACYEHR